MRKGRFLLFSAVNSAFTPGASSGVSVQPKDARDFRAVRFERRLAENQAVALLPSQAFRE